VPASPDNYRGGGGCARGFRNPRREGSGGSNRRRTWRRLPSQLRPCARESANMAGARQI